MLNGKGSRSNFLLLLPGISAASNLHMYRKGAGSSDSLTTEPDLYRNIHSQGIEVPDGGASLSMSTKLVGNQHFVNQRARRSLLDDKASTSSSLRTAGSEYDDNIKSYIPHFLVVCVSAHPYRNCIQVQPGFIDVLYFFEEYLFLW